MDFMQVELQRKNFVDPQTGFMQTEVERVVLKPPELGWVPHYGYNSLFPLLMGLLPLVSHSEVILNLSMYLSSLIF